MNCFREIIKKTIFDTQSHLIHDLNFSKFRPCHFFTLLTPNFMQNFRNN